MDIVPVKKYKQPQYPTKKEVLDNPRILKNLPDRWKDNVYVGAAFSTLLIFTLTSCAPKNVSGNSDPVDKGTITATDSTDKKAVVAPIFEHGSGRGSFGCVSVAPPAFLSEEEAFQVVQEEAKKYGITFEKEKLVMDKAEIPETKYFYSPEVIGEDNGEESEFKKSTISGELKLDGYDNSKKIAFEFISSEDYEAWHKNEEMASTVQDYNFLSAAKVLKEGVNEKNGDTNLGIFYDPMPSLSHEQISGENDINALQIKLKKMAQEDLRNQVVDFLKWLKAQGIV
jgi:hypothetical protein